MNAPGRRLPDVFLIGAARCGTTYLYSALAQHPQIWASPRKEPHWFAPDLDGGQEFEALLRERDGEAYAALFAGATPGQLAMEASTGYLLSNVAPRLIHEAAPDARILVSLRDPVRQLASIHALRRGVGMEDLDLEEAIDAEEDRRQGRRMPRYPLFMPQAQYRSQAHFGAQLARWLEHFPREQIHISLLDDLADDPAATLFGVQDFLGIDRRAPASNTPTNPVPVLRSVRLATLIHRPGRAEMARRIVPRPLHSFVGKLARMISSANLATAAPAPVPAELRDRLRADLEPDVRQLSALLGQDLVARWWTDATA